MKLPGVCQAYCCLHGNANNSLYVETQYRTFCSDTATVLSFYHIIFAFCYAQSMLSSTSLVRRWPLALPTSDAFQHLQISKEKALIIIWIEYNMSLNSEFISGFIKKIEPLGHGHTATRRHLEGRALKSISFSGCIIDSASVGWNSTRVSGARQGERTRKEETN